MSPFDDTPSDLKNESSEARYDFLLEQVIEQQQIWIIVDQHGSVLLNNDGEDCVPVWPSKVSAIAWLKADWADCKTMPIALTDWQARWTKGLREDDYSIAAYPNADEEAIVISAEEFDDDIIAAMQG